MHTDFSKFRLTLDGTVNFLTLVVTNSVNFPTPGTQNSVNYSGGTLGYGIYKI